MNYTTWLRWGVISALFLIPVIPFIVANGTMVPTLFFPYITGKNFIFRILVAVALFCYTLLALREPKYRPTPSLLMWCALAFVGWMGIATFFSADPIKSLWSNFERMEGYIGLVHLFVLFVVAGAVLAQEKLWHRLFNVSLSLAAFQGLYALMQVTNAFGLSPSSQSGTRADTTFGNATYLAVYLLIHFFLTLYMLARTGAREQGLRWAYGAALVLQFCGILFTETRGAILGLVVGLSIAALYYIYASRGAGTATLRKWAIGLVVAFLAFGGLLFALRDTAVVQNIPGLRRVASITLTETTVLSRLQYIWPMAFKGAAERPLLGWGQENFNFVFNKYYEPGMYAQEAWFDRAHNQFLDWLIAGGIPAFLLHIGLYLLAAYAVWRAELTVAERAALLGLLGAYAFNNSFVFDNLVSACFFWLLLAYLHSHSARKSPSLRFSKPLGEHGLAVAAPLVALVVLGGAWALNASGMARAATLVQALSTEVRSRDASGQVTSAARNPADNLASFNQALSGGPWPYSPLGVQETVEQMLQFASNLSQVQSASPETKMEVYQAAFNAGEALMAERKGDARLHLFMAVFLGQVGQAGEALKQLDLALSFSPKKQQIMIQLGTLHLSQGSSEQALAYFKQAFESEPRYNTARVFYAAALRKSGQGATADALLVERFDTAVPDDAELLQAYVAFKQFDAAAAIWRVRVEKDPKNPDVRLGLASMYFGACDLPRTLATIREVITIAPTTAPQMQTLIKQIEDGTLKCPQ